MKLPRLPFQHRAKDVRVLDSDCYEIELLEPETATMRKALQKLGGWKWKKYPDDPGSWLINKSYLEKLNAGTNKPKKRTTTA